jgi:histidine triad (HIT) family protein
LIFAKQPLSGPIPKAAFFGLHCTSSEANMDINKPVEVESTMHAPDCIFCKIIEGTVPSKKVYETETIVAFHDIAQAAPVHILVIPKKHIPTMNDVSVEDGPLIAEMLLAAQQIAREHGISDSGYRLVNNCNSDGGQLVYHLHFHLLGGQKLGDPLAKSSG